MNNLIFNELDHTYHLNGKLLKSVTQLLTEFGISDYSSVPDRYLIPACEFGKYVHECCEFIDLGVENEIQENVKPWINQWVKFKKDYKINEFELIEEMLYSKWGFAGTFDRFNGNALIDIKTCSYKPAHEIQTALYKILIEENHSKLKVKKRITVHLNENSYKVVEHKDKSAITVAKSILTINNYKIKQGIV